jgi:signal transduction histidine kinase
MTVQSELGCGTIFVMWLPITAVSP